MDDLLHDYFQAEIPHPWPTYKMRMPVQTKPAVSFWSRYSGRLALAACVALMVAGYLTLGGFFAPSQGSNGVDRIIKDIGDRGKDPRPGTQKPHVNQIEDPVPMPTPTGHETTKNRAR
jgi:hypothetical protein